MRIKIWILTHSLECGYCLQQRAASMLHWCHLTISLMLTVSPNLAITTVTCISPSSCTILPCLAIEHVNSIIHHPGIHPWMYLCSWAIWVSLTDLWKICYTCTKVILEIVLSGFQKNCNHIKANLGMCERRSLLQWWISEAEGIWGTQFPINYRVSLLSEMMSTMRFASHRAT